MLVSAKSLYGVGEFTPGSEQQMKRGSGNCYIIENGVDGILVDTGKKEFVNRVMEACRQYHVKLIVLTHAHFDHAENAAQISSALGIPIGIWQSV